MALTNPESTVFYSVPAIIGAFIIQFAFSSQPHLFNKVLALEQPRDMAKMILVYVVSAFAFLLVIFGGLYAAVTVPGVEQADNAIFSCDKYSSSSLRAANEWTDEDVHLVLRIYVVY